MQLTPREFDKLFVYMMADVALKRKAKRLRAQLFEGQSALDAALSPFAIPALTSPVLVTWLFTLPRQYLGETAAAGTTDAPSPT